MKKLLQFLVMLALPVLSFGQKDLPNPPADLQTLQKGSYIIAMDNTNQVNAAGDFNLKAYGLISYLLNKEVHLKWVIRAGKLKDENDFSAYALKIMPVASGLALYNFKAGPFVISANDTNGVAKLIDSFYMTSGRTPYVALTGNDRPCIYKLNADLANVDIRYDLAGFKPKIAILTDGGNEKIHKGFIDDAGIPDSSWAYSLGTDLTARCFTIATEPHNDKINTPEFATAIKGIRAFIESGGNFLAQCAAVENYENNISFGYLQTTTGLTHHNNHYGHDRYVNSDVSYAQFEGFYHATQTGHLESWDINSTWANNGYMISNDPTTAGGLDNIGASVSKLGNIYQPGGMVFYLGNHDFDVTHMEDINGIRMYMNAVMTPVTINDNCRTGEVLAIKWYSFMVRKSGRNVNLVWNVATDVGRIQFFAERSFDGVHFTEFANIPASIANGSMQTYSTRDINPGAGLIYYRIRQTDYNGTITYSETRKVNMDALDEQGVTVIPNPSGGKFTVLFDNPFDKRVNLMIFDNAGRRIYNQNILADGQALINLDQVQPGVYTLMVMPPETAERITRKIIIIK